MLKLHPEVLKYKGKKAFVVLPYHEFEQIDELLQDAYDIKMLRTARQKSRGRRGISLEEAKDRLGL